MYLLEYPILVQRKRCQEMDDEPPGRPTINSSINKFEQIGSVNNIPPPGRPVTVIGKATKEEVSLILDSHPQPFIWKMNLHLSISMTSLRRIYNALGFKPCIPRLMHQLNENDFDRWVEFCETLLSVIANESDIIKRVIWSDEATFKFNGVTNRRNCVYWEEENLYITYEHTILSEGFTVWSGLWYDGVIGPYFFEDRHCTKLSYHVK